MQIRMKTPATVWQGKKVRLCRSYGATVPKAFGTGGKGIRTPGLLIANETLYQLSYTPLDGGRKLSRCENLSAREKNLGHVSYVRARQSIVVKICLQGGDSSSPIIIAAAAR